MTDPGRLDGTVALITGASSGIGQASAAAMAADGATVSLVARRKDRLDELASRISADASKALVIEADASAETQVQDAVEQTVSQFGRLDIVVANAGVMLLGPIEDAPTDEWRRMVDINLLGLIYLAHAALPHLVRAAAQPPRDVADIVLVSSVAGRVARLGSGVYNATKHGVGAFGESLRQEVTQRHVRVGIIEPGAVSTELAGHNRPEVQTSIRARFGDVELMEAADIADAIAFMVSRPRHVAVNEILIRPTEQQG
ncbi:MAG TPA: SDR family NAD(P)-dependent oxidoreductase [Jatrophihabitantaceae bacterium]|jgi:NADP-dependent 3-hydroxy acid dehydrogenase YdfG